MNNIYGLSKAEYDMKMLALQKQQEEEAAFQRQQRRKTIGNIGFNLYKGYKADRDLKIKEMLNIKDPKNRSVYARKDLNFLESLNPFKNAKSMVGKVDYSQEDLVVSSMKPVKSLQKSLLNTPSPIKNIGTPSISTSKPSYLGNLKPVVNKRLSVDPQVAETATSTFMDKAGKGLSALGIAEGLYQTTQKGYKSKSKGFKAANAIQTGASTAALLGLAGPWGLISLGSGLLKGKL